MPVLSARQVGFAMLSWDGYAYLFDAPGGRSRRVDVAEERLMEVGYIERHGARLTPRVIERD